VLSDKKRGIRIVDVTKDNISCVRETVQQILGESVECQLKHVIQEVITKCDIEDVMVARKMVYSIIQKNQNVINGKCFVIDNHKIKLKPVERKDKDVQTGKNGEKAQKKEKAQKAQKAQKKEKAQKETVADTKVDVKLTKKDFVIQLLKSGEHTKEQIAHGVIDYFGSGNDVKSTVRYLNVLFNKLRHNNVNLVKSRVEENSNKGIYTIKE